MIPKLNKHISLSHHQNIASTSTPTSNHLQQHPPQSPSPWYRRKFTSPTSDIEENDGENEADSNLSYDNSIEKTPSPKKTHSVINNNLDFSSTPLSSTNLTLSFSSPMNKLNDLHLESDIIDEEEHSDTSSNYEQGDKTINEEDDEQDDERGDILQNHPQYVNTKKRNFVESPMDITPLTSFNNDKNNSTLHSKLSFSNSDSTPCPPQPKRRRLKFKQESSKSILDLNFAKKKSIDKNTIPIYQERSSVEEDEEFEDIEDDSNNTNKVNSTPISQSTPASSRASTPPLQQQKQQKPTNKSQEYGESINGYKFLKPTTSNHFKYETPINKYTYLRDAYIRNDYQIIGELPITSAGLMNEDDEGVHVGDKRIDSVNQIRIDYLKSTRFPLLPPHFYEIQDHMENKDTIIQLITRDNLLSFYNLILEKDENMLDLLKLERIKWHPDRWMHNKTQLEIAQTLSQTINQIIDEVYND